MKSYIRQAGQKRTAYDRELERAMYEGFMSGVTLALYSMHLNQGFGKKRLNSVFKTCKDLTYKKRERQFYLNDMIDFIRKEYGIDPAELELTVKIQHEKGAFK